MAWKENRAKQGKGRNTREESGRGRKREKKIKKKGKKEERRKSERTRQGTGQNSAFWYRSSIYAHVPNFVQIGLFCHPAGALTTNVTTFSTSKSCGCASLAVYHSK